MTESSEKTIRGVVEAVNRDGFKIGGACVDIEAIFVHSTREDKWFVRSVSKAAKPAVKPTAVKPQPKTDGEADFLSQDVADPPAEEPANPDDGSLASPEALKYAEDLALKEGWTSEDLEILAVKRFGKSFEKLSGQEASRLIVFFGGYQRTPLSAARS